jgi:hypothetical protein
MNAKEASDMIEAALSKGLETAEDYEEGDLIIDWILVSFVTNPDKEKASGYPMFFSNGDMPTYRARGLLTTALMYLQQPNE